MQQDAGTDFCVCFFVVGGGGGGSFFCFALLVLWLSLRQCSLVDHKVQYGVSVGVDKLCVVILIISCQALWLWCVYKLVLLHITIKLNWCCDGLFSCCGALYLYNAVLYYIFCIQARLFQCYITAKIWRREIYPACVHVASYLGFLHQTLEGPSCLGLLFLSGFLLFFTVCFVDKY